MPNTKPTFRPAERVAALPPYFYADLTQRLAQLRARRVDVIRLDAGSPDLPPAPFIVEALQRSAEKSGHHGYMPYGGTPEYRAAWAEFYGRRFGVELDPQSEVLGLIGSKEGIFNLTLAFANPGDVVLVPDPAYATYANAARFAGAEVVYLPLLAQNKFLPDLHAISPDALRRAKLMWLNYPNNPTGAIAPPEFFAEVIALARAYNFIVAHDAPYTEIAFDDYRAPSLLQLPGAKDVGVELHSCSKTYNMAGWRVGVVAGNPEVVGALGRMKGHIDSSTFRPIMDAAAAALTGDQGWVAERNAIYRERRDVVVAALREAGFVADTPRAAIYVWVRLPEGVDDGVYAAGLLEATGVSVTPGSVLGPSGAGYFRIALCHPAERLREAMGRLVEYGVGVGS
jgi:LL-diaminopimelate aminotransferase